VTVVDAVRAGEVERVVALLAQDPALATARPDGQRTLLHVFADWPGNRPRAVEMVAALVGAGADVNARFVGRHRETPLHWAASNDDVPLVDALLDAGADIDADGAVIADGTPLSDAVAFGCRSAALRLVARGAAVRQAEAAALGLLDRLTAVADVDLCFWYACHGGSLPAARLLFGRGATLDHLPDWERLTPLDAADRAGADELVAWLRARGARRATELS
jgi:ankyrin repeat protein